MATDFKKGGRGQESGSVPQNPIMPRLQPLLKWPGGKRAIASQITALFDHYKGRYFEAFLGGGAVFFHHRPASSVLSDVNPEVINCYEQVKRHPSKLAVMLLSMENSEAEYYRIRQSSPKLKLDKAARLIYLTSLSFNGIYRQNLDGKFNVPYGYKTGFRFPTEDLLLSLSESLQKSSLSSGDFEESTSTAGRGDLAYFDPPYTVAHSNNGFVKYNATIFSWHDQRRLAKHARRLADRGCQVSVSNADHPSIEALYPGFRVVKIERQSVIAASSKHRKKIIECLFQA